MFPEAVDELQKAVQLSPDYALAIFNLGMAQAHAGQIDPAIGSLQRALQLDATNFEAAYNLGVAYIQKKQLEPAAEAFRRSVTINPDLARGHRALGETLLYQGNVDRSDLRVAASSRVGAAGAQHACVPLQGAGGQGTRCGSGSGDAPGATARSAIEPCSSVLRLSGLYCSLPWPQDSLLWRVRPR